MICLEIFWNLQPIADDVGRHARFEKSPGLLPHCPVGFGAFSIWTKIMALAKIRVPIQ
jgi:hypothetical protein